MEEWQVGLLIAFAGLSTAYLFNISKRMDEAVGLLRDIAAALSRRDWDR